MLNPLQNAQIMMSNFKLLKSMILYYISKTIQNVRHLPAQIDSEYTFFSKLATNNWGRVIKQFI